MDEPTPKKRWWKGKRWVVALALWLLLATYVSAYVALMRQGFFVVGSGGIGWNVSVASYPHPALYSFFAPAEWVDRRIRPRYWDTQFFDRSGRQIGGRAEE